MLRVAVFLLLSISFVSTSTNFLQFSVKPYAKSEEITPIWVLNDKFEKLAKFVQFPENLSGKVNGRVRINGDLEKVILQLSNPGFLQDQILVSLKNQSSLTIHTDDYKMKVSTSRKSPTQLRAAVKSTGCDCIRGNCACCLDVQIPEFSHSVCVNATYNPQTIGLDLSIGVDGHYFSEEISIRNPPPVCFSLPIPGAEHIAGLCVAFEDLDIDKESKILSGCVELEVELIHLRVLHIKLGCFRMPI